MAQIKLKQLTGIFGARLGSLNYNYPAAATSDITTALTTLLSTAGRGGVGVPVTVSTGDNAVGVITVAPLNKIIIRSNATSKPLADTLGNEVYGRITEAAGVYSLALFVEIAGVETAYTPPSAVALNFYPHYRFEIEDLPANFAIATPVSVTDDPSEVTTKQENFTELLTVTALNAVSVLTNTPDDIANVTLFVNGQAVDSLAGLNFTLVGTAITLLPAGIGYDIAPGDRVVASYTYEI